MWRVLVSFGTRPEAIKLASVIRRLDADPRVAPVIVNVGQHAEMLDRTLASLGIEADHRLDIIRPGAPLDDLTARGLTSIGAVLDDEYPDLVVVQGDTTTVVTAALASFYRHIPVAHVEAGLRTGIPDLPFPEEMNRRLTAALSTLHYAPTTRARDNLLAEGINPAAVTVTGNTAIDAVHWVLEQRDPAPADVAAFLDDPRRLIVVTAHRRESWGAPMEAIGEALADLARDPKVLVVFPIHPNPVVREAISGRTGERDNIVIIEPLPYASFVRLMAAAHVLLTDSGGIQEEAAALRKPVIVMRDVTERPEGVTSGTSVVVGRSPAEIVREVRLLLDDPEAYRVRTEVPNPYGDGRAAERITAGISSYLQEQTTANRSQREP